MTDNHEPWKHAAQTQPDPETAYGFNRAELDELRAHAKPRKSSRRYRYTMIKRSDGHGKRK